MPRFFTRRNFLNGLAGSAVTAVAGGVYARCAEPHWLEVRRVKIPSPPGKDRPPIRILHLADLHASASVSLEFIAEAIRLGLSQLPDLIALTGDFFTNRLHHEPAHYAAILRLLAAAAPTFACLGNHDGGPWTRRLGGYATVDEVQALLRAAGIRCLLNEAAELTVRGRALQLFGTGDLWSGMCLPQLAFSRAPARAAATRIVLNHNPDAKDLLRPYDWDIMLCGHTHGGQIRLPFFGTPFAPVRDKRYIAGLYPWNGRQFFITRGVGNLHGVRFNCRPEVSVLEV